MTKSIEREHIYRLDLLSAALSLYPAQAILVRLNEISSYNENVIARLRGLLNATSTVMAQVVSGTTIPSVNIYKRLETTKVLCKINDTIRMEQELEKWVRVCISISRIIYHLAYHLFCFFSVFVPIYDSVHRI